MRIIAFIEESELIEKILRHLGLWDTNNHDPPCTSKDHISVEQIEIVYDDYFSQLPAVDYWIQ